MKCPFCGRSMEPGNIFGRDGVRITWYPESKMQPYIYTLKNSLKRGGVPLSPTGLDKLHGPRCPAYICRTCSKGIFDIPPLEEVSDII